MLSTWWRHQMETFSALLALCAGNSPVTGEFPAQRPMTRNFDVFFDLRLNKRLNNREAGDLRRHHTHYDVIVMEPWNIFSLFHQRNLLGRWKLVSITKKHWLYRWPLTSGQTRHSNEKISLLLTTGMNWIYYHYHHFWNIVTRHVSLCAAGILCYLW